MVKDGLWFDDIWLLIILYNQNVNIVRLVDHLLFYTGAERILVIF